MKPTFASLERCAPEGGSVLKGEKTPHPDLTLNIIVNGQLGLKPACVSECLKDIALRTVDELLDANGCGIYLKPAANSGAQKRPGTIPFRRTLI